jgi:virginiamycin B lyase
VKPMLSFVVLAVLCCAAPLNVQAQSSTVGTAVSVNSQQATITEVPTPSTFSLPQGVDIAGDGSIWYAETSAGKIAQLKANQTSAEFPIRNGGQPVTVKIAASGIWFTDGSNHAIGLLNPTTGSVEEYAIPSGGSPLFLQLAQDGSKWFSETTGVGRLTPNGVITEWMVALEHPDDNIEQLSIDATGNIWFVERNFDGAGAAGTNKVRRLNPNTNVISTYLVPTFGGNPAGVQANANGTVWVSEYYANAFALLYPQVAPHSDEVVSPSTRDASQSGVTVRPAGSGPATGVQTPVAPSNAVVRPRLTLGWIEYTIPTANALAEDMRIDRLGRVWFEGDSGLLGVLNPYLGSFTDYTIPSANSGYYDIALDQSKQELWFTEAGIFAAVTTKIGHLDVTLP